MAEPSRRSSQASTLAALFLVAIIGGAGLFVSGFSLGRLAGATPGTGDDRQELFRPFWDAYNDVTTNYIGEVDPRALVEGAIKGVFQALGDPYSSYMTEEEYRSSMGGLSGEFEGVGVEMLTLDPDGNPCATVSPTCRVVIAHAIRRSPAISAGLQADDVLLAVDGVSTEGLSLESVVETVRGPRGTTVVLTIERAGSVREVSVVRDVIQREDVHGRVVADGRIGYVAVSGFSSASAMDLRDIVDGLINGDGVAGLILDLRNDPGGYVDSAQQIASEFVGTGPLYWDQAAGHDPIAQNPTPGGVATDPAIPMVVLVNGGTASASEIVAAALQGNDRAQLIGTTTFGKGTIQEFKELPGAGGYRLSVRKWLTPEQTWIHGVGLTPDVVVDGPPDPSTGADPQFDRAVEVLLEELDGSAVPRAEASLAGFPVLG